MLRRRLPFVAVALAAAPAARADGGTSPPVSQGWDGVLAPGGKVRYVAVGTGRDTAVEAIRTSDGRVLRFGWRRGSWGIPQVAYGGSTGGLSHDGSRLVLASTDGGFPLRKRSSFLVLKPSNFQLLERATLRGDFAFDALSPNGSRLYLIQH